MNDTPAAPAPNASGKWIRDATTLTAALRSLPRPRVFTNGCFDILHLGHVRYLQAARALGACLVVGINSDASVRTLGKGTDRPINPLADRAEVVAALGCVDLVVAFDEPTPLRLIEAVQPDFLVKGGDWQPDSIVGAEQVTARGGQVRTIPLTEGRSTSELLRRIRAI